MVFLLSETALEVATPTEIDPNAFICAIPPITSVQKVRGQSECHVTCMRSPGCVVFGYQAGLDEDGPQCAITADKEGLGGHQNLDYEFTWYTIY